MATGLQDHQKDVIQSPMHDLKIIFNAFSHR